MCLVLFLLCVSFFASILLYHEHSFLCVCICVLKTKRGSVVYHLYFSFLLYQNHFQLFCVCVLAGERSGREAVCVWFYSFASRALAFFSVFVFVF